MKKRIIFCASYTIDGYKDDEGAEEEARQCLIDDVKAEGIFRVFSSTVEDVEEDLMAWTKKLDLMHYAIGDFNSETLCGKVMLGNNYASMFPKGTREECPVCLDEVKKRGLKHD